MNAVVETLACSATLGETKADRDDSPAAIRNSGSWPAVARLPLRQARQNWTSSLGDADLQCLLQVLEADLIPQLLNSYAPALHASDVRLTSG